MWGERECAQEGAWERGREGRRPRSGGSAGRSASGAGAGDCRVALHTGCTCDCSWIGPLQLLLPCTVVPFHLPERSRARASGHKRTRCRRPRAPVHRARRPAQLQAWSAQTRATISTLQSVEQCQIHWAGQRSRAAQPPASADALRRAVVGWRPAKSSCLRSGRLLVIPQLPYRLLLHHPAESTGSARAHSGLLLAPLALPAGWPALLPARIPVTTTTSDWLSLQRQQPCKRLQSGSADRQPCPLR